LETTGKTTLLEIIRYLLDAYAGQIVIESLLQKAQTYSSTTLADVADLLGRRFVTTSEPEARSSLAEAQVKQLTGMGQMKACRKYENFVTFTPVHKIFMDANHKVEVRGRDEAIWARLQPHPIRHRGACG